MNCHDRNQTLANFSRLCRTSKQNEKANKNQNSTKTFENISKYFISAEKPEASGVGLSTTVSNAEGIVQDGAQDESFQSPYTSSLTEIENFSANTSNSEEKDFKTPKHMKKWVLKQTAKSNVLKSCNTKKRGRKPKDEKCKQMVLTKVVKQNLSKTDVNPEHLELAIALSKSLHDSTIKCESQRNEDCSTSSEPRLHPSTQLKIISVKQMLGQFGFKTNTNHIDVMNHRTPLEKRKKISRYQYITPILFLRTQEDREKIISEKVSLILSENSENPSCSKLEIDSKPLSENLLQHLNNDSRIFRMNRFPLEYLKNVKDFYVRSLNLPQSEIKCGSSLKDWNQIPGRELSPFRSLSNINVNTSLISDQQHANKVQQKHTTKEEAASSALMQITENNSINFNFVKTTQSGSSIDSLDSKLHIECFSNRSISPELFTSDDEMVVETLQQKSDTVDPVSPSLLNLTPQKNRRTSQTDFIQVNPNKYVVSDEDSNSDSLLNITPTKRKVLIKKDMTLSVKSPNNLNKSSFHRFSERNSIRNKCRSPDLSDVELFENGNGIYTFENFSKENDRITEHYFDLTKSSDEEVSEDVTLDLKHSLSEAPDVKNSVFDKVENSKYSGLQEYSPSILINSSIRNVSKIIQKSVCLQEESMIIDTMEIAPEKNRQSKSLDITKYVCNILNEENESSINNSQQNKHVEFEVDKNDEFDLTQSSINSSVSNDELSTALNHSIPPVADGENSNSIKKKYNETISYSDIAVNVSLCKLSQKYEDSSSKFARHNSFKSSDDVNLSQESIICISDEELNYSSRYGTPYNNKKQKNMYAFSGESDCEENVLNTINPSSCEINFNFTPKSSKETSNYLGSSNNKCNVDNITIFEAHNLTSDKCNTVTDSIAQRSRTDELNVYDNQTTLQHPRVKGLSKDNNSRRTTSRKSLFNRSDLFDDSFNVVLENPNLFTDVQDFEVDCSSTSKPINNFEVDLTKTTPKSEILIKETNVTPMSNYDEMNTPSITKELQKFGLKPLKRQRGVQILKHIYESTHPVVGQNVQVCDKSESDDDHRVIKRRKSDTNPKKVRKTQSFQNWRKTKSMQADNDPEKSSIKSNVGHVDVRYEKLDVAGEQKIEIVAELLTENETAEDLVFERKVSTKTPSCRVPLHIAWHNLVSSQPELRKNILLYEPLQLEVLYKTLKEQGYKYHIEDLLMFLDRKCITIRTSQNQSQQYRCSKKSALPQESK